MSERESDGYKEFAPGDKVIVSWMVPGSDKVQCEVEATVLHSPSNYWMTWDAVDVRIETGPLPTKTWVPEDGEYVGTVGKGDVTMVLSRLIRKVPS